MKKLYLFLLALFMFGVGGCFESVNVDDLKIACESNDDCPAGQVCDKGNGICIFGSKDAISDMKSEKEVDGFDITKDTEILDSHDVKVETTTSCEGGCDDNNPCTEDKCDEKTGKCVHKKLNSGECDDGNLCTENDSCVDGVCKGTEKVCDDGYDCTEDSCNPDTGDCETTLKEGFCFINGECYEKGEASKDNPCLGCNPDESQNSFSILEGAPCDDGVSCTEGEKCNKDGFCELGNPISGCCESDDDCDDNNPCTKESCNIDTGECEFTKVDDGTPCGEGNLCIENAQCKNGFCSGEEKDCDDKVDCTIDKCDPETGKCVHEILTNYCYINSECYLKNDKNPENPCEVCDPEKSETQWTPLDDVPCEDGSSCTTDEKCVKGVCVPQNFLENCCTDDKECDDGNVCTDDFCDKATGKCTYQYNKAQCDDFDPCTENDFCNNGTCQGTLKNCNDGIECTKDFCNPSTGECDSEIEEGFCLINGKCYEEGEISPENQCAQCLSSKNKFDFSPASEIPCDDGKDCTQNDKCVDGVCTGTPMSDKDNTCDGFDDDCDGETDEDASIDDSNCKLVGVCNKDNVTAQCVNGVWVCNYDNVDNYTGNTETKCDGLDNDCDGETDEDLTYKDPVTGEKKKVGEECNGIGECGVGVVECAQDGKGVVCSVNIDGSNYQGTEETCDGKDNDCDGETDEDLDIMSSTCKLKGVCNPSNVNAACVNGKWICDYSSVPDYTGEVETLCDGLDNDCDGETDEDFTLDGKKIGDSCGVGACQGGVVICKEDKTGLICSSEISSDTEICDGKDNDCDGETDENLFYIDPQTGAQLKKGQTCHGFGECGIGVVECGKDFKITCSTNPNGSQSQASEEICDGKDNNCNGKTDEGMNYKGIPLGELCEGIGECGTGIVVCSKTTHLATCSTNPDGTTPANAPEVCDGKDNDCDGKTDEDLDVTDSNCKLKGVCSPDKVKATCENGEWICDYSLVENYSEGTEQWCDGLDNDCDGETDEDFSLTMPDGSEISGINQNCGVGACAGGITQCTLDGTGIECSTAGNISDEVCDGIDNDCDGKTDTLDDSFVNAPCENQKGVCAGAKHFPYQCNNGTLQKCGFANYSNNNQAYETEEETCDGLDNDCDGQTDEGCDDDLDGFCDSGMKLPDNWNSECWDILVCAMSSEDENFSKCEDGKSQESINKFNALFNCATNICEDNENCDPMSIFKNQCHDEYQACIGISQIAPVCSMGVGDCNDDDPGINPVALEVCNEVDDNCNGKIDDDPIDEVLYYADYDKDSYGNWNDSQYLCKAQYPYTATDGGDCDDTDKNVHPGAKEFCNSIDDNCDGVTDEDGAWDCTAYYPDEDQDGHGAKGSDAKCMCSSSFPYTSTVNDDCDDTNNTVYPGAPELCDGLDNDCDGNVEQGNVDSDGDGFKACDPAECDDNDSNVYEGAPEICDGKDDNCDGYLPADELDFDNDGFMECEGDCNDDNPDEFPGQVWYEDKDNDGYGTGKSITSCVRPEGYKTEGELKSIDGDCNDTNDQVNPEAEEYCNEIDDNCNGETDEENAVDCINYLCDSDGDDYGTSTNCDCAQCVRCLCKPDTVSGNTIPEGGEEDCDDSNAAISPGAEEYCNSIDDDCDGLTDEEGAADCTTYFYDKDGDQFGINDTRCLCGPDGFYTALENGDCNDSDYTINPGVLESCDGVDNNCNKQTDEGCDDDGDGYCDANMTYNPPEGGLKVCQLGGGDCDDENSAINPGALENCYNNIDDNCNKMVDDYDSDCTFIRQFNSNLLPTITNIFRDGGEVFFTGGLYGEPAMITRSHILGSSPQLTYFTSTGGDNLWLLSSAYNPKEKYFFFSTNFVDKNGDTQNQIFLFDKGQNTIAVTIKTGSDSKITASVPYANSFYVAGNTKSYLTLGEYVIPKSEVKINLFDMGYPIGVPKSIVYYPKFDELIVFVCTYTNDLGVLLFDRKNLIPTVNFFIDDACSSNDNIAATVDKNNNILIVSTSYKFNQEGKANTVFIKLYPDDSTPMLKIDTAYVYLSDTYANFGYDIVNTSNGYLVLGRSDDPQIWGMYNPYIMKVNSNSLEIDWFNGYYTDQSLWNGAITTFDAKYFIAAFINYSFEYVKGTSDGAFPVCSTIKNVKPANIPWTKVKLTTSVRDINDVSSYIFDKNAPIQENHKTPTTELLCPSKKLNPPINFDF